MSSIYTPRYCIDKIKHDLYVSPCLLNPTVCTKIPYKGYEISISMDSSLGDGDLFRSDIRVWDKQSVDCSFRFLKGDATMLYGDGETLRDIMLTIDEWDAAK